jgi:hypothetical protein
MSHILFAQSGIQLACAVEILPQDQIIACIL